MSRAVVISLFLVAAMAFPVVGWFARGGRTAIPRLIDVTGFVMQYQVGRIPVGRIAVLGFWWWAGWHFFAR